MTGYTRSFEPAMRLALAEAAAAGERAAGEAAGPGTRHGQDVPVGKRTLELNPTHPLITGLQQAHKDRGDDPTNGETAELLYGAALLAEGNSPEDPARFAELLAHRLARTV